MSDLLLQLCLLDVFCREVLVLFNLLERVDLVDARLDFILQHLLPSRRGVDVAVVLRVLVNLLTS